MAPRLSRATRASNGRPARLRPARGSQLPATETPRTASAAAGHRRGGKRRHLPGCERPGGNRDGRRPVPRERPRLLRRAANAVEHHLPAVVGCSPSNATVAPARLVPGAATRMLRYVRTRRVRAGEAVRVRLGCRRGTRLVYSGSGVAFFTERPPSRRIVRSLRHRHRRSGSVSRTFVAAPRSVGDDERVEVQVSALCSAR
jgi:hypothetical protein